MFSFLAPLRYGWLAYIINKKRERTCQGDLVIYSFGTGNCTSCLSSIIHDLVCDTQKLWDAVFMPNVVQNHWQIHISLSSKKDDRLRERRCLCVYEVLLHFFLVIGSPLSGLWMVTSMLWMWNIVPLFPPRVPIFLLKQLKLKRLRKMHPTRRIHLSITKLWKVLFAFQLLLSIISLPYCTKTWLKLFYFHTEEMIRGLQQLGWKKVDVSFHSAFWPFFAHNNIHVLLALLHFLHLCVIHDFIAFSFYYRWKMNGFIMLELE